MSDEIFGPLAGPIDVRNAVKATIEEWIETYLAVIERHYKLEPRSLPLPRSYVLRDDGKLDKSPEDQTPCVVILCPATAGKPKREGDGTYRASYAVSVAVITASNEPSFTSDLAQYYAMAVMALIVHNGTLGGVAESTSWQGQRNDDLAGEGTKSVAAGTNFFQVLLPSVVRKGAGLQAPPEEPYEPAEPIAVKQVDVELEPEEIT